MLKGKLGDNVIGVGLLGAPPPPLAAHTITAGSVPRREVGDRGAGGAGGVSLLGPPTALGRPSPALASLCRDAPPLLAGRASARRGQPSEVPGGACPCGAPDAACSSHVTVGGTSRAARAGPRGAWRGLRRQWTWRLVQP